MAKQTITQLIDDIDGSEAEETITFGIDGASYEIDLNAKNAAKQIRKSPILKKRAVATVVLDDK